MVGHYVVNFLQLIISNRFRNNPVIVHSRDSFIAFDNVKAQLVLLAILTIAVIDFCIGTFIPPTAEEKEKGLHGYTGERHSGDESFVERTVAYINKSLTSNYHVLFLYVLVDAIMESFKLFG